MSRVRIEALLTAVLTACGGATESSGGGTSSASPSSSTSSSSSSSSSGSSSRTSSGTNGDTGTSSSSGQPCGDTSQFPYSETKKYDLEQACAEYAAQRGALDAGTEPDAGPFDCSTLTCEE